jgi:hypothetical protein
MNKTFISKTTRLAKRVEEFHKRWSDLDMALADLKRECDHRTPDGKLSLKTRVAARLGITPQSQLQGEKRYVREKEAGNLRDRWPTVAPPMRDSFGEVACLDSQPHLPPCDSALMRVAAYGFVFFIYENRFPGSRYMHFDPHNSI